MITCKIELRDRDLPPKYCPLCGSTDLITLASWNRCKNCGLDFSIILFGFFLKPALKDKQQENPE